MTADRVRVRDLVCALETWSVTRETPEVHAASVHEFFDWSGLLRNSNVKALEVDKPAEFKNPLFSKNHGKYLVLLSDILAAEEKATDSESPSSQKRKTGVAKPLETTAPSGRLDRPDRGYVQSRRYVGSCASGGRYDHSPFRL